VKIQVDAFWFVTACSVVVRYKGFGGPYCLHLQGRSEDAGSKVLRNIGEVKMEAVRWSETLVK
jgi:hypothetical protein